MVRARQREAWEHTSLVCAVIASHAFGAKKARKPREFNPLHQATAPKPRRLSPKESMALLDTVSVGR